METRPYIEQSALSADNKDWQMVALPNREPLGNWQEFWEKENQKLYDSARLRGKAPDEYPRYSWHIGGGIVERSFKVILAGNEYSGWAIVYSGGWADRKLYSASFSDLSVAVTDPQIREQISRLVLPTRFFKKVEARW